MRSDKEIEERLKLKDDVIKILNEKLEETHDEWINMVTKSIVQQAIMLAKFDDRINKLEKELNIKNHKVK